MATMGPPPSPKEPRRSGRRAAPSASTSKSPAGSPASDTAPKPKENSHRHSSSTSSNSSRNKRSKQEENDDIPDEPHKNGVNGNARAKRKGKEKEKPVLVVQIANGDDILPVDVAGNDAEKVEEEEEEAGITRCICTNNAEDESDTGEFMAMCEECKTWQHGQCMGYAEEKDLPQHYYCEQCRPDLHVELLRRLAKRTRQSSATSHHTATLAGNASRSSRSHSPTHYLKPTKRRNTMNSRDAAYEESFQALIEATAAEAAAHEATNGQSINGEGSLNGHADEHEKEVVPNPKRKRKRSDDDVTTTKRTRSASTTSDRPAVATLPRDPTPVNENRVKSTPVPSSTTASKNPSRSRRGGARKSQAHDLMSVDGDEGNTASARRPGASSRSKTNTDQSRRAQTSAAKDHPASSTSHTSNPTNSRAYHQSHAYAVSQQPLFTSWNLPDYLAHLQPMLPTGIPRPLEVRGSGVDSTGRESLERTTERGVKVKWPSKRMSVGDMNKRVRALVEWVGREQASALERSRRREALEKVFTEGQEPADTGHAADEPGVAVDGALAESPVQEKRAPLADGVSSITQPSVPGDPGQVTMKMMEELMEELISFQERFGPGAKSKERERRTVTS